MRTEDGKVVVAIETDWEFSPKPSRKTVEDSLTSKALHLYGLLVDKMNNHIIREFNDYYDENYPNGIDSEEDLKLYDYGISGRAMEVAKDLSYMGMTIVNADMHTATYTFFDEKHRNLVTMHLGKMHLTE